MILTNKLLTNKIFHYIGSRYLTYFIQFINSLFIAVHLGPYYLGIWGFITLVIQYLNQINLGIANSVNAIIAIHKNKEWYVKKVIGTSLTMMAGLSLIIILFFIVYNLFNLNIGSKYNFSTYAPVIAVIGILAYFNTLFSNIFRVYGRVMEIAINQSAFPVLMLITVLIFRGKNLLLALVVANLFAFLLSFFLYIYRTPVQLKPLFINRLIKSIQIKGWHLFIYSTSFYFIFISTRSFVSAFYQVSEFGYFTFAYALANSIQLFLQSFSFLVFPKIINHFSKAKNESAVELLTFIKNTYTFASHLLIHIAIIAFPIFLLLFPQYEQTEITFKLIVLSIVLYANSFGYSSLLIAKNKEKKLGHISFIALTTNILFIFLLINVFHVTFEFVALATLFANFSFAFGVAFIGRKELMLKNSLSLIILDIFPIGLLIPYSTTLIFVLSNLSNSYCFIPLLLFVGFNKKYIIESFKLIKKIVNNQNLINID